MSITVDQIPQLQGIYGLNPDWKKVLDELKFQLEANVKLQAENKRLKGLLGVAICPNAMNGCQTGIIPNPNGEPEPCQWCAMTKQALKEN